MSSPDALRLLVASISSSKEIKLLRDDTPTNDIKEATHFSFENPSEPSSRVSLAATTPTRYLQLPQKTPYDLRSLLFCYINRDVTVADYFRQAREIGVQVVSVTQKRKLVEYLQGKAPADDNEVMPETVTADVSGAAADSAGADGPRPAKRAKYVVNKEDLLAVKKIMDAQEPRQLNDRKRVLRGPKPHNFEGVKSLIVDRIAAAKEELKRSARGGIPAASAPTSSSAPKRRLDPIIIVSPSSSALITMNNVKDFLENGVFVANKPDQSRSAEDVVSVMHKRNVASTPAANVPGKRPSSSSTGIRTARYLVVNDMAALDKFGSDAWDRVVCVMTTGQEWQFRAYKWPEPKELFHHVKGVHFAYTNTPPNDKVKGWNVVDLRIDPAKRHIDKGVVAEFWRNVEAYITETKPWLAY